MPIKMLPHITGNPEWGDIAGSLDFQTDLKIILDDKSSIVHNHNLSELDERNYSSLTNLPELSIYARKLNGLSISAYTCDGIDDYLEIYSSPNLDLKNEFSFIFRFGIVNYENFQVIAAKGVRNSNTGWTLFCDNGILGFSIGDGAKFLTASHSKQLSLGLIYQVSVIYSNTSKELKLWIDDDAESFDFSNLGVPATNTEDLLISKNPANNNVYHLILHSAIFYDRCLSQAEIEYLYDNGKYSFGVLNNDAANIDLLLLPDDYSRLYWFDKSGYNNHAIIYGGVALSRKPDKMSIPLMNITDDLLLPNSVPAGFRVSAVNIVNQSTEMCELSISIGTHEIISSETIQADAEVIFNPSYVHSFYDNSDILIEFSGSNIQVDIIIILEKLFGAVK